MSIKKKIPILFSILVLLILVGNNSLHYILSKNQLIKYYDREISLLAQLVSYQVEIAKEGSQYVEKIIGRELRTASIAIRNSLPANHQDVTNQQLESLAESLMVSHITLLERTPDDIVGVKSSDPHEINMSTKGWGYWYDAFEQLMDEKSVNVGIGLTLPDYWSGPIEVASSNPDHTDKWGYYYDGSTNYIINPYLRDNEVLEYEERFGPGKVMQEVTNSLDGVLELTVFNPKNFGKKDEVVHLNGNSFVRLSDQPIWYGNYNYKNENIDSDYIQSALIKNEMISYTQAINGKYVKKTFVPIQADANEPYVIGFTYDYNIIQAQLNKELENYVYSSLTFMLILLLISLIFSHSITKPIAQIVNHVNDIARGNFGNQLKIKRKDELGHLASDVNALSNELKSYTDDLKNSREVIKFQAYHDPLTTLPNRRFIQEKLEKMFHEADSSNGLVAVIFMDIDRFKHINDSMGHNTGDLLIQLIAERIKKSLANYSSVVARQGGDEFIILLKDISEEKVEEIVKGMIQQIKQSYELAGREIFIGASCGISFYPKHTKDMHTLINNADLAMYSAKKQGGNKAVIFNPNGPHSIKERIHVETRLRKVIEEDQLDVFYQPKMNAMTNKLLGVESLVRWNDPELGYISPIDFIQIAEETGLIQPLFESVLKKAMVQIIEWNQLLENKITVSVNVSPVQFLDSLYLVNSIKSALNEHHFPAELLEIEITESALLNNMTETIEALEELNRLGVAISIDDFGTGYSSLSYLQKLPLNYLKIDQSFIKGIDKKGQNTEISDAIIHLARSLKLGIIAEGVEFEHQKQYLLNNGCHVMQGYLFDKPLMKEEFKQRYINSTS
ncbi:EAL domain-containing protein [Bacillus sp. PS06]|uniref:bifunctional diguanylate cyclase/phosphodiesterase n=1 Tax=Bacillus sp. PS06 TaxID=2764176 RepID=UPI001781C34D|nr:EAL domain-containing protein [Bacillus sp. PS06]MBD8067891.1 EAL domain-containing protein [Bacillus sp. PS06]